MVGELIRWYLHDSKDVIMKLTLCIVRYIVFATHKINAFVPEQVDIGLDNSAKYTIWVCCDASYQILGLKLSEMSGF